MRLNKKQKYAINWLVSQKKEVQEIVKELKLQIKIVENYINKTVTVEKEVTEEPATIKSKDLMIRHTGNKNNNTVSIMTKEASELNDETKKKSRQQAKENKNIFRIS